MQTDPEFSEANGVLSITHYLNSDLESARETASQALKNSYRLSETSKPVLKANRYIFDGDFDRGVRVIEIWTRVQPNSTDALASLAEGNVEAGRKALNEALEIWSEADADYLMLIEAESLMREI